MAELAARALKSQKVKDLAIANRTLKKARPWLNSWAPIRRLSTRLPRELVQADIVIFVPRVHRISFLTGTRWPPPLDERRGRPLFFIDIAVPRDVDPAVDELDNVYLYNIDDLEGLVNETRVRREAEIDQADRLVNQKAREFSSWYRCLASRGTRAALRHNGTIVGRGSGARMSLLRMGTRGSALALAQSNHVKKGGWSPCSPICRSN
jgi:glutamyl-tRNA reductase